MSKHEVVERFVQALRAAADRLDIPTPWPEVTLADRFGVGGLVASHVGAGRDRRLDLARRLRDRLLLEASQEITLALDANGVPHCFARGGAMLGAEYGPGEREMADLDLYVPADDASATRAVLGNLGYEELPTAEQGGPAVLRSHVDLERSGAGSDVEAVALDLHWAVEPVTRLLPRPGHALPADFWERADRTYALPRPSAEHHAALLVHHLVHHDLLHLRGVLDFALVLDAHPSIEGAEIEKVTEYWNVRRAARWLHRAVVSNLGVAAVSGIGSTPRDWRARLLADRMRLAEWMVWAATGPEEEHQAVSVRRIACRMLLIDPLISAGGLLADVVAPPSEHLAWRWPEASSTFRAWGKHLWQVGRKVGRS